MTRLRGVVVVLALIGAVVVTPAPEAAADDTALTVITDPIDPPSVWFANSYAIAGDTLVISRNGDPLMIFVYHRDDPVTWSLDQTLEYDDPDGYVSAILATNGSWIAAAVETPTAPSTILLWRYDTSTWVEDTPLALDPDDGGISALLMEGTHLVAGQSAAKSRPDYEDYPDGPFGQVVTFELDAGAWVTGDTLIPVVVGWTGGFGTPDGTAMDGDRLAVYDHRNLRLYTYEFASGTWGATGMLTFGCSGNCRLSIGGDWIHLIELYTTHYHVVHWDGAAWQKMGTDPSIGPLADADHMVTEIGNGDGYVVWERVGDAWEESAAAIVDAAAFPGRSAAPYGLSWRWDAGVLVVQERAAGYNQIGVFDTGPICFGQEATIVGTSGDDVIDGTEGPDVIAGLGGDDVIHGLGGDDVICGGSGDDLIDGGPGDDLLDGSFGTDLASYETAPGPVTVDMAAGTATGAAGSDTLVAMNGAVGGPDADTLIGSANADELSGGPGDDLLVESAGTNVLDGGPGTDTVTYAASAHAVDVDLAAGTTTGDKTEGPNDQLDGIENVVGSSFGDTITGDGGPNHLAGGAGNDLLMPGGGDDEVDGGPGSDTISYQRDDGPVVIDLMAPAITGEGTDTYVDVEKFRGSRGNDHLSGTDGGDRLDGRGGHDVIDGGKGRDRLKGGGGDDVIYGGKGDDKIKGGYGSDYVVGGPGDDKLWGFVGHGLDSKGFDVVSYLDAPGPVVVALGHPGSAVGVGTDTIDEFRMVVGSRYDDELTGILHTETILVGWDGADHLVGRGSDLLAPGGGNDVVESTYGTNVVTYLDAPGPVTVRLGVGTASGMGLDVLIKMRGAVGSRFDDSLSGAGVSLGTWLSGMEGADVVTGSDTTDWLYGDDGADHVYGQGGIDFLWGGGGTDYGNGGADFDHCGPFETTVSCESVDPTESTDHPKAKKPRWRDPIPEFVVDLFRFRPRFPWD